MKLLLFLFLRDFFPLQSYDHRTHSRHLITIRNTQIRFDMQYRFDRGRRKFSSLKTRVSSNVHRERTVLTVTVVGTEFEQCPQAYSGEVSFCSRSNVLDTKCMR